MPRKVSPHKTPAGLDRPFQELWRKTRSDVQAMGFDPERFHDAIEAYVRKMQEVHYARRESDEKGTETRGSQGQLVLHPAVKRLHDAQNDAAKLRESLCLTPKSYKEQDGSVPDAPPEWLT